MIPSPLRGEGRVILCFPCGGRSLDGALPRGMTVKRESQPRDDNRKKGEEPQEEGGKRQADKCLFLLADFIL